MLQRLWLSIGLLLLGMTPLQGEIAVPPLSGAVVDAGQVLSPPTREFLEQELRRLHGAGGSQIAVLSVKSLEGEAIEAFSIRVSDQWKLGAAGKDNGVLLLLAIEDRKVRIEVGQGLEGDLPDAYAGRIIQQKILPLFRGGDYDAGVIAGIAAIVSYTDPQFNLGSDGQAEGARRVRSSGKGGIFSLLLFFGLFLLLAFLSGGGPRGPGSRMRRSTWGAGSVFAGSSWGGSSGGSWGGGRGGFGGGGGGFSGGGASGGW